MCMKAPASFRKAIGQDAPPYGAAWQRAALRAERVLAAPDGCDSTHRQTGRLWRRTGRRDDEEADGARGPVPSVWCGCGPVQRALWEMRAAYLGGDDEGVAQGRPVALPAL